MIGRINLPLVNEGDALFHVAIFKRVEGVVAQVEALHADLVDFPDPDFG